MIFVKNFWKRLVILVGPLIPLLWTFGDVYPAFQSQGWSPLLDVLHGLHAMDSSDPLGMTPAQLLVGRRAVFDPHMIAKRAFRIPTGMLSCLSYIQYSCNFWNLICLMGMDKFYFQSTNCSSLQRKTSRKLFQFITAFSSRNFLPASEVGILRGSTTVM